LNIEVQKGNQMNKEFLSPEIKELISQEVQREISQYIKPQLLSISQAAQRLRMRQSEFIKVFLLTGQIPFVIIKTSQREIRRISEDSISSFIQQNKFIYQKEVF
jgi:hypothetical protein